MAVMVVIVTMVMIVTVVVVTVVVVTVVVLAVLVVVFIVAKVIGVFQVRNHPQHSRLRIPKMDALGSLKDDRVGLDLDDDAEQARRELDPAARLDLALESGSLPTLPALRHDHEGIEDDEDQHWQQNAHEQPFEQRFEQ